MTQDTMVGIFVEFDFDHQPRAAKYSAPVILGRSIERSFPYSQTINVLAEEFPLLLSKSHPGFTGVAEFTPAPRRLHIMPQEQGAEFMAIVSSIISADHEFLAARSFYFDPIR